MLEQLLYLCEGCHTPYKDKVTAVLCEKSHKKISRVELAKYHAKGEYPDRLLVTFEGGETIWYKR